MRILLKYQPIVSAGSLGAALVRLSRQIGRLRAELASGAASFVLVTRLAELPRLESDRLLRRLRSLNIDVSAVVANAVGAGTCARCASRSARDRAALRQLRASLRTTSASAVHRLAIAPAEYPPPRGGAALRSWRSRWVCANL
jgi:anion-transporting  ArsA/GET3 family ATPase